MSQPNPFDPQSQESFPASDNPYAAGGGYGQSGYGPANPNQTPMLLGVGSLVCGCIGLLSCMPLFGCCLMPMPVIGLILGGIGLTQKPDQTAKLLALAGIAVSVLSIVIWVVMFALGMAGAIMDQRQFN